MIVFLDSNIASNNHFMGSDFDDFLEEEGILEEVKAAAMKKVIASMITQTMAEPHITKVEMTRLNEHQPNPIGQVT